jgi:hypothetical protein
MPFTPPPSDPNFKFGVGRITTDRYDFEAHLEGVNPPYATNFRHTADMIDMSPLVLISGQYPTNVQLAIELLAATSLPTPTGTNTFLNWSGSVLSWQASAGGGGMTTLTGDVIASGSGSVVTTVVNIHGASVPIAGSLVTGNVLQVTGASTLSYGPIHLNGGANSVTGVLPVSNLPTLAGDVTGALTANTVVNLRNNPVEAQTLGIGQDGFVLTWTNSATQWQARAPAGGGFAAGGDLTGTSSNQQVIGILTKPLPPLPGSGTTVLTWNGSSFSWSVGGGGGGGITSLISSGNPGAGGGQETGDVTTATGPLSGAVPGTVVGLQGWPIATTPPADTNPLIWSSAANNWFPGALNLSSSSAVSGILSLAFGGTGTALGNGTQYNVLVSNGNGTCQWSEVNFGAPTQSVTGQLPTVNGGTGLATIGSNGQVLTSNGSSLYWNTPIGGSGGVNLQNNGSPVSGGPFTTLDFTNPSMVVTNIGGSTATISANFWNVGGNVSPSPATLGSTNATTWSLIYNNNAAITLDAFDVIHLPVHNMVFTTPSFATNYIGTNAGNTLEFGVNSSASIAIHPDSSVTVGTTGTVSNCIFGVVTPVATIAYAAIINNTNTAVNGGSGVIKAIAGGTEGTSFGGGNSVRYLDCWSSGGSQPDGWVGSTVTGTLNTFNGSDRRIKENIVNTQNGLETLKKIKVRDFNRTDTIDKTTIQGFIAQELYKVWPIAVYKGGKNEKTNPWAVASTALIPLMVKSIQDVSTKEEALELEVKSLHKKIAKLEAIIQKIK